jgi:hypothetical protein
MKQSFPPFVRGLLALSVLFAAAPLAATTCAIDDPDGSRTAAARASAEEACTNAGAGCANAPNHGTYLSCIAHTINGLVQNNGLPKSCRGALKKCAARSTCGKPGAVTCCLPNQSGHGRSKCKVARDAASCAAKGGCAGSFASCCDACAPDGSCNLPTTTTTTVPAPVTTTTTTTVPPPVTTTTL